MKIISDLIIKLNQNFFKLKNTDNNEKFNLNYWIKIINEKLVLQNILENQLLYEKNILQEDEILFTMLKLIKNCIYIF